MRVDAAAEAAIGRGDDALTYDQISKAHDALGDKLRMLDNIRRMADHARQDQLVIGKFDLLPYLPFMFVADIARLEGVGLYIHRQQHLDDVAHRDVRHMLDVPAAPAQVEADAVLRQPADRVIERVDPYPRAVF